MIRLVWLVVGLVGGVMVGRNAGPVENPSGAAVVLALVVGCGVCWWAAYRGKSSAVATAVAVAVAKAHAEANAKAEAIANQAVQIVLAGHGLDVQQLGQAAAAGLPGGLPSFGGVVLDELRNQVHVVDQVERDVIDHASMLSVELHEA